MVNLDNLHEQNLESSIFKMKNSPETKMFGNCCMVQQIFSVKDQMRSILGFTGHTVLSLFHLLTSAVKAAIHTNGPGSVLVTLYLRTPKCEISYDFHVSRSSILLIFVNHLEKRKSNS